MLRDFAIPLWARWLTGFHLWSVCQYDAIGTQKNVLDHSFADASPQAPGSEFDDLGDALAVQGLRPEKE